MYNSQRSARVQSTPTNMAATLHPVRSSIVWLAGASSVLLLTSITGILAQECGQPSACKQPVLLQMHCSTCNHATGLQAAVAVTSHAFDDPTSHGPREHSPTRPARHVCPAALAFYMMLRAARKRTGVLLMAWTPCLNVPSWQTTLLFEGG